MAQCPILRTVAHHVVKRETARPDVPAGRVEGWVRVEDRGLPRCDCRPRHIHGPRQSHLAGLVESEDRDLMHLEAVVIIGVIYDLRPMGDGKQETDVLATEMPPRCVVHDLEVQCALPLHGQVDHTLNIIILAGAVHVCDDDIAPSLPRHLAQHPRGRRRLEDRRDDDPALTMLRVPRRLEVTPPSASKGQHLARHIPDDIAREPTARNPRYALAAACWYRQCSSSDGQSDYHTGKS
mmetsp:Transcript_88977/g.287723  ORF Transcript_88977/g.287723 Transcript_88977/m.287723 type:complete len:237 (-) Transcript_88977:85-795(-)